MHEMLSSLAHCTPTFLLIRTLPYTVLHSFVRLESEETKMYIDWSGTSKRTDRLPSVTLRIPREHGESLALDGEGDALWR